MREAEERDEARIDEVGRCISVHAGRRKVRMHVHMLPVPIESEGISSLASLESPVRRPAARCD